MALERPYYDRWYELNKELRNKKRRDRYATDEMFRKREKRRVSDARKRKREEEKEDGLR